MWKSPSNSRSQQDNNNTELMKYQKAPETYGMFTKYVRVFHWNTASHLGIN